MPLADGVFLLLSAVLSTADSSCAVWLSRSAAARNWVGLRAPHPRLLFLKRVGRKQRHVRFGQIPLIALFCGGGQNLQLPSVCWLSYVHVGATTFALFPAAKKSRGFDVALYRRGAGRLVATFVHRLATRAGIGRVGCRSTLGSPFGRTVKRGHPTLGSPSGRAVRRSLTERVHAERLPLRWYPLRLRFAQPPLPKREARM